MEALLQNKMKELKLERYYHYNAELCDLVSCSIPILENEIEYIKKNIFQTSDETKYIELFKYAITIKK